MSHPEKSLAPPNQPHPYQGDSKPADMKDVTGIHIKSSLPLKGTGDTQSTQGHSYIRTLFKSAPVAVSSKFIETKLNKMKRQRNCSQLKE